MKKRKHGFTIVELVIVIAVVAILASILIPTFSNVIQKAKESKALMETKSGWDNYLVSTGGNFPQGIGYILYEHKGLQMVFKVDGVSFVGLATEEEIAALKGVDGKIVPERCNYAYNPDTFEMLNRKESSPTANTTLRVAIPLA